MLVAPPDFAKPVERRKRSAATGSKGAIASSSTPEIQGTRRHDRDRDIRTRRRRSGPAPPEFPEPLRFAIAAGSAGTARSRRRLPGPDRLRRTASSNAVAISLLELLAARWD